MSNKLTQEEFLENIKLRNKTCEDQIFLYPEIQRYVNQRSKLTFKCEHDHVWESCYHVTIYSKRGCPICKQQKMRDKFAQSWNTIVKDLPVFDNVKYLKDTYKSKMKRMEAECVTHGTFSFVPFQMIKNKIGCPVCYKLSKHKDRISTFTKKASTTHNNKYDYSISADYTNASNQVSINCPYHGQFNQRPDMHVKGHGCPKCVDTSVSQKQITWLEHVMLQDNVFIQHAYNLGEYKIPGTKYSVDGFCDETNTVYEFHGDAFHGNLNRYADDDLCHPFDKNITAKELFDKTVSREKEIRDLGYNLIVMWESDFDKLSIPKVHYNRELTNSINSYVEGDVIGNSIRKDNLVIFPISLNMNYNKNMLISIKKIVEKTEKQLIVIFEDEWVVKKDIVQSKIDHILKRSKEKVIHARKCIVREIDSKSKNVFLDVNHIQGRDVSSIRLGAFYNDQLVAVMTFSANRIINGMRADDRMFELVRFATDINYRVVGVAGKLLHHFKRYYKWTQIYSYADIRWSVGNLYNQLGFNRASQSAPSYFYIVNGTRKHRWNYRKSVLCNKLATFNSHLTEWENMKVAGFHRLWDCGTLKFVIENK